MPCRNLALLSAHKIRPEVRDERYPSVPIDVASRGQFLSTQEEAVNQIVEYDDGILCPPTAFGTTAVAAWLVATRGVHTGCRSSPATARPMGDRLSKASASNEQVKDLVAEYGQGIVNEWHHISAFTFEQVIRQVKAKYAVGLTATPTHKNGYDPII